MRGGSNKEALLKDDQPSLGATATDHVLWTLEILKEYSKGKRSARQARLLHKRNDSVAFRAALCSLLLSSPFWCWPLGTAMSKAFPHASAFYIAGCSGMLLQILFTIYVDLGNTVALAFQGILGTGIAWINSLIIYAIVGPGTFGSVEGSPPQSAWLPLCHSGSGVLVPDGHFKNCFLNIHWEQVDAMGLFKVGVILIDLILVLILVLDLSFDNNTRAFSLSCTVWFLMAFLDPSAGSYEDGLLNFCSTNYMILVTFGSAVAVLCMFFPLQHQFDPCNDAACAQQAGKHSLRALQVATNLAREAFEAVGVVIASSPETFEELVRTKAIAAFDETNKILDELDAAISAAWWECVPPFDLGEGGRRRRWLSHLSLACRGALRDVARLHSCAEKLKRTPGSAANRHADSVVLFESVPKACAKAKQLMEDLYLSYDEEEFTRLEESIAEMKVCANELEQEWAKHRDSGRVTPEAAAFLFVFWGVIDKVHAASAKFHADFKQDAPPTREQALGVWQTLKPDSQDETHPSFVLRNTFSVFVTFCLGLVGFGDVLPAYSFMPASIVSVIIYKYAGSSEKKSLGRLTGVVLGKVIGTLVVLAFAVEKETYVVAYVFFMYKIITFVFYNYIGDVGDSFVACLTVGYAGSAMVPTAPFRVHAHRQVPDESVQAALLQNIINAVIGVSIMHIVDVGMVTRASQLLKDWKEKSIEAVTLYAGHVFEEAEDGKWNPMTADDMKSLELSKQACKKGTNKISELLEPSIDEPKYGRAPLKANMYRQLQAALLEFERVLETIVWCVDKEAGIEQLVAEEADQQDTAQFALFFPLLKKHVEQRMHNILILAYWVSRDDGEDGKKENDDKMAAEAEVVRKELMRFHYDQEIAAAEKTHTDGSRLLAPTHFADSILRRQQSLRASDEEAKKFFYGAGKFLKTVFAKPSTSVPQMSVAMEKNAADIDEGLMKLQRSCGAMQPNYAPEDTLFRVGRVELLVGQVRGLLGTMKVLELELLEY